MASTPSARDGRMPSYRSVGVSSTPFRGTGFQPVQRRTDSHVRATGLDTTVQATLRLGETPKPRASARR
ncbi:MAG: hypothetical protein NZ874_08935 [Fimbriimonadales bacterium]|nr:hypothetical protein [Fimbriimonadales bacterium]